MKIVICRALYDVILINIMLLYVSALHFLFKYSYYVKTTCLRLIYIISEILFRKVFDISGLKQIETILKLAANFTAQTEILTYLAGP